MRIKQGDNIIVISGKDKGKKAKVLQVLRARNLLVVEGVNMKKRHQKPRRSGQKGQIVSLPAPVHISNVQLVDPKTGTGTRIKIEIQKGKKVRVSKKSGAVI